MSKLTLGIFRSQTDSIICFADKFVSTLEVIPEEQEEQSDSDTLADERVEDSQLEETPSNNPEQTSDTALSAHSGNDFKRTHSK